MIHMQCQALFYLKKKMKMLSAAIVVRTLSVKKLGL